MWNYALVVMRFLAKFALRVICFAGALMLALFSVQFILAGYDLWKGGDPVLLVVMLGMPIVILLYLSVRLFLAAISPWRKEGSCPLQPA